MGAAQSSYATLRDALTTAPGAILSRIRKRDVSDREFWALRNVSFEVQQGEVVGIVGRNGAGKSTLLKLLSRISEPTEGWAEIHGRVGSLLEVGTGFHPELSGRENITLNGAILGMSRREIASKFDEIVAFAEVERFIDTAVKHYSSGMYLRLAFAVAAHLEPDILIVDEVLAVGDAAFQKKCLGKMQDVAGHGRTVLFVSHNMSAVQSLCSRAIWLKDGSVHRDGRVGDVIPDYLQNAVAECAEQCWDEEEAPGSDHIRLLAVRVRSLGKDPMLIERTDGFDLIFTYRSVKPDACLNLSVFLFNQEGVTVFNTTSAGDPNFHGRPFPPGVYTSRCRVPGRLLNAGIYRVKVMFVLDSANVLYRHEDALAFEVKDVPDDRIAWYGNWPGVVRPELEWCTTRETASEGEGAAR